MNDEHWHTSFRLSKEAEKTVKKLAKEYRVSNTDIIEMILAGKIDVPKVLSELQRKDKEQGGS